MKTKRFGNLGVGEEFEVYGDNHLNYNYPKVCRCKKVDSNTGVELEGQSKMLGIQFSMGVNDIVFKAVK